VKTKNFLYRIRIYFIYLIQKTLEDELEEVLATKVEDADKKLEDELEDLNNW
jgi:hypothetical protein